MRCGPSLSHNRQPASYLVVATVRRELAHQSAPFRRRLFEGRRSRSCCSPAPEAPAQIAGIKPEDVANADKAAQPRRVILHNPLFGLTKQPLAASAGGHSVFHV